MRGVLRTRAEVVYAVRCLSLLDQLEPALSAERDSIPTPPLAVVAQTQSLPVGIQPFCSP